MGYIYDVEKVLQEMLADLPEESSKQVIKYMKERLLESYRNGLEAAKTEARGKGRKFSRER